MPANADDSKLETLSSLLASARELAKALESEHSTCSRSASSAFVRRILEALSYLPPDDVETITTAIERAIGWRRVNESIADATGVRLRVNPNPRLFIRVVEGQEPGSALSPDPDEVLVGTLRILRRAPILVAERARAVWEPAAEEALGMLTSQEREACRTVAHAVLALIERAIAQLDGA